MHNTCISFGEECSMKRNVEFTRHLVHFFQDQYAQITWVSVNNPYDVRAVDYPGMLQSIRKLSDED